MYVSWFYLKVLKKNFLEFVINDVIGLFGLDMIFLYNFDWWSGSFYFMLYFEYLELLILLLNSLINL